jgi:Short C-terminal domain
VGIFSKRMKDPVRGMAQVVGSTRPPHNAMFGNCKLTLVVQADGVEPTPVEHQNLLTPVSKWPRPGMSIPVTVDRANPDRISIEWDEIATGEDTAAAQAQAMADAMRAGGSADGGAEASGVVGQIQQMFPGATVQVMGGGQPSPEQIAKLERAMGRDLDGDGQVGGPPPAVSDGQTDSDDRIEQLERLAKLRESGALSAAEFEAEKRRVLGS